VPRAICRARRSAAHATSSILWRKAVKLARGTPLATRARRMH
jgi:hypothetical protein